MRFLTCLTCGSQTWLRLGLIVEMLPWRCGGCGCSSFKVEPVEGSALARADEAAAARLNDERP